MALDRSRVLETAQKYLAKGQYDRAIAEYQKLVRDDPKDVRTWLKIGDLHARKGSRTDACDTYQRVASQYAEQGFFLKAVAVYKQILKLDPGRLDVQLALADMYEQLQLVSDALTMYESYAASCARDGDIDKALTTLGRMADLDPDNIPIRIKQAEALSKAGKTAEAAEAFAIGARLLKEQGRMDDFVKVAERLLYHKASETGLARELAELYLDRNDPKRALSKLQLCFKADPKDIYTLQLLARAFHMLGQLPKTVSVYREVARIHQEAGRSDERAATLKRILELDPRDGEARRALAGYAPPSRKPSAPPPSAVVDSAAMRMPAAVEDDDDLEILEPDEAELIEDEAELIEDGSELLEEDEAEENVLYVEDEPSVEIAVEPPGTQGPARARPTSIPPDVAREAQIARLLTECDVFERYGLKAKVIDQLLEVIEIAPAHIEARERLKEAYVHQGQLEEAVEQLYAISAALGESQPQLAEAYLRQVLELDPYSEPAASTLGGGVELAPKEEEQEEAVLFIDGSAEDEDLRTGPDLVAIDSTHADRGPFEEEHLATPPEHYGATGSGPLQFPMDRAELLDAALAPMSPEEFEAAPLRPSDPGEIEAAQSRGSRSPGEIEEILDEAEFFVAQGLLEEARGTLQEALASHPDHPLLIEKLADLGQMEVAEESATAADSYGAEDESFLLAEKLAEELGAEADATETGSDVLDVESVFAQFKKGVEEQVGLEDSDTHFDLGIAYKEMGLLDDAIHEFELAKSNPQRECIAFTMMGLCHVEKGEIADAIAQLKKGLYVDAKTEREEQGLYFELGAAYELLHDPKEALYYYQKVQKRSPGFRKVGEKIESLTNSQLKPTKAPPKMESDDVDRAFDDLMGDK